ncbi:hypothetical protein H9P43_009364 [Blastocladiella emersonii ATCC 22665]|nr:hypothetical protein H9P43_009364 [Blastocladiella emersonii ATCC 22665]
MKSHAARAFHSAVASHAASAARDSFRALGHGRVHLKYHRHLPVALVQLDNPAKLNALSGCMMAELADCVDTLQQEQDKLAAVILTGAGGSFCTGFDLDVASSHVSTPEGGQTMAELMHDTLTRLRRLPLVSFAAVEGYAMGGGAELTTATDFRVVTYGSTIRFVHLKMGAAPGWGGAYRLSQLLGHPRALQLLMSCKKLDGEAAQKLGLAQWVCPTGQALAKCIDVLEGYLGVGIPEDAHRAAAAEIRRARQGENALPEDDGESASPSVDEEEAVLAQAAWLHFTPDAAEVPWMQPGGEGVYEGNSLRSVHAIKTGVIAAADLSEDTAMQLEREAFVSCWGSAENLAALNRRRASPPPSEIAGKVASAAATGKKR